MYDYIIIGAGSAGCVLANRLSADPNVTVLLLEAGGTDKVRETKIPLAFSKLFRTERDWAYYTDAEPQLGNRKLYWPRGKMIGGSSSINAMIYIRGHQRDYDSWAEQGNEGWSFADVLPYFKKAQHQERGETALHGTGGPLNVADLRTPNPLSRAFVQAAQELGQPRNNDFNGADTAGFGLYQVTQKNGARWSTAAAYLKPAQTRANLTVQMHAHTTRVLFEACHAVGVAYVQNGQTLEARARREVILCGGAINSPQLLLLSGVGPAAHLRAHDLAMVVDLPGVGQNLQDHIVAPVLYRCTQPLSLFGVETLPNLLKYLIFKRGSLTSNVAEAGGFIKTEPTLAYPNLQYHFAPVYLADHGSPPPPWHGFTLVPTLLYPQSRGVISLQSPDPLAPPRIQANYLHANADLQVLVAGLKFGRQLAQANTFAPYRGAEEMPGAHVQSDAEWGDFARAKIETIYHPVGTCKMGSDPLAVVDAQLRVHGVTGLRVVDASIMPTIVGGNTNAPTIMIAEKAADLIRADA